MPTDTIVAVLRAAGYRHYHTNDGGDYYRHHRHPGYRVQIHPSSSCVYMQHKRFGRNGLLTWIGFYTVDLVQGREVPDDLISRFESVLREPGRYEDGEVCG